jgi:hypothetical protein
MTGPLGSPWLSTMTFLGETLTEAVSAAAAVHAFWNDLRPDIGGGVSIEVVQQVQQFTVAGDTVGSFATPAQTILLGSAAGDPLPRATQGLIRWHTGVYVGGREVRGRTFVPGPTETFSTGAPTATYLTTAQTAVTNLLASVSADLHVWSKAHTVTYPATSGDPWNDWAVLRSRRD